MIRQAAETPALSVTTFHNPLPPHSNIMLSKDMCLVGDEWLSLQTVRIYARYHTSHSHHTVMLVLTCSTTLLTTSLTDTTSQISPFPPSTNTAGPRPSVSSFLALSASYVFLRTPFQVGNEVIGPHDGSELLDPSEKRY